MNELNPERQRISLEARARVEAYINRIALHEVTGGLDSDDETNEGKNG